MLQLQIQTAAATASRVDAILKKGASACLQFPPAPGVPGTSWALWQPCPPVPRDQCGMYRQTDRHPVLGTLGFSTASAALRYQEQLCSADFQQLPELTHIRSTQQQHRLALSSLCHPRAHESGARARKAEASLNFCILLLEGELLSAMFPISQTDLFILAIYREETARSCAAAFHTNLCLRTEVVGTCEQRATSKPWRPPDDLGQGS